MEILEGEGCDIQSSRQQFPCWVNLYILGSKEVEIRNSKYYKGSPTAVGSVPAASMAVVSSAANLLAQLEEDDEALRLNALQSLNNVVHEFWFQIASSIASVEAFYEDETFTHRELAALVASKVSSRLPSKNITLHVLTSLLLFKIRRK